MEMLYDYTQGQSSAAPGVVVVVTRGKTGDMKQAKEEMLMMNLKKVHVVTIGVGPHAKEAISHLQKLSCSLSDVFTATYKELSQKADEILEEICSGRICAGGKFTSMFV